MTANLHQHNKHYPSTAGHVLSCAWESLSLDQRHYCCTDQLNRSRYDKYRATAFQIEPPTAPIIVEAFNTSRQLEEAH